MKIKQLGITILSITLLAGCGQVDRMTATVSGHQKTCVDGVEYVLFSSGASVAYTPEGKVKTCQTKP